MIEAREAPLVPGRECGSCGMCCKVFQIDWLEKPKPAGKWCHHAEPGRGCRIWQDRPEQCGAFFCDWRRNSALDEAWRPDRAGFVIYRQPATGTYEVTVDAQKPDAWRKKPYYPMLLAAAGRLIPQSAMIVRLGWQQWVLLPEGEVEMPSEHRLSDIRFHKTSPMLGASWRVEFVPRPVFG